MSRCSAFGPAAELLPAPAPAQVSPAPDPKLVEVAQLEAEALLKQDRYAEAWERIQAAVQNGPDRDAQLAAFDGRVRAYQARLASKAWEAFEAGRWDEAHEGFAYVIQLGLKPEEKERVEAAKAKCAQALAEEGVRAAGDRPSAAASPLRRAMQSAYAALGQAEPDLGKARQSFRLALAAAPGNAEAEAGLVRVNGLCQQKVKEAVLASDQRLAKGDKLGAFEAVRKALPLGQTDPTLLDRYEALVKDPEVRAKAGLDAPK